MAKRLFTLKKKVLFSVLGVYVGYNSYVSINTNYEIYRREQEFLKRKKIETAIGERVNTEFEEINDQDEENFKNKFKSLKINGRFENPFNEYRTQTIFEFLLARIFELFDSEGHGKNHGLTDREELDKYLPVYEPDFELLRLNKFQEGYQTNTNTDTNININKIKDEILLPSLKNRLTFTWIGQSCAFIQISGLNFITDPQFSNHLINNFIGPKRIVRSPCEVKALPNIDYVLISHNHPDHLDNESIKKIGNKATWIVPLGLGNYLSKFGVNNVIELNWWDRMELPINNNNNINEKFEILCVPAMHWAGRGLLDTNESLWGSFLIFKNEEPILYHVGDTGYCPELFQNLSKKVLNSKPIKLSMIPIGSYDPEWHQRPRHVNPEESYKIFKDIKGIKMVGVHWGTFICSSENFLDPIKRLKNINDAGVLIPEFGKTWIMDIEKLGTGNSTGRKEIRDGKSIIIQ